MMIVQMSKIFDEFGHIDVCDENCVVSSKGTIERRNKQTNDLLPAAR